MLDPMPVPVTCCLPLSCLWRCGLKKMWPMDLSALTRFSNKRLMQTGDLLLPIQALEGKVRVDSAEAQSAVSA